MTLKEIILYNDTRAGKAFDLFINSLIIVSIASFTIETLPNLNDSTISLLWNIELIIVAIFSIEYLLRIILDRNRIKYIFSFYGLIDIIAIAPFYIQTGLDLRSVRIFRLMRLLRVLKIFRTGKAAQTFKSAFSEVKSELIMFFIASLFTLYLSAVGIYFFESNAQPNAFGSIFHCLWWAVAALTTVGYGDVIPITVGGKVFSSFIILIGVGIIAVPTGLLSAAMANKS